MPQQARRSWIEPFELAPSTGRNLGVLDGLRALAVIAVFARHAWGLSGSPKVTLPTRWIGLPDVDLSPFVLMCSNGVDLFFVLSGYLLARSFIAADLDRHPPPDLRKYFRARFFRILPGYWLALAVMVMIFLPALLGEQSVFSVHGALAVLAHVPVLQTAFPFSYGIWGPGSPYWTLTIEILFYLSLPWVVRLFYGRRALAGLVGSLVLTLVWLTMARSWFPSAMSWIADHSWRDGATSTFVRFWLSKQLPGYAFSFAVGIFVANVTLRMDRSTRRYSPLLAPVSFIAGALLVAYSMRWLGLRSLQNSFYDGTVLIKSLTFEGTAFYYLEGISMAAGFGLVLFGLVVASEQTWTAPFRFSWLRVIGILGFGIYLWHMPFLYLYTTLPFLGRMSFMHHWLVLMAMTGVAVLAVSVFSFLALEKPMIRRGRSLRRVSTESRTDDDVHPAPAVEAPAGSP